MGVIDSVLMTVIGAVIVSGSGGAAGGVDVVSFGLSQ